MLIIMLVIVYAAQETTKVYQINVIYYDDNSGSTWQLYFNTQAGSNQTFNAFKITNNAHGGATGWKSVTFSAGTCITFNNPMNTADFYIKNTSTSNIAEKFAFVSITTTCPTSATCSGRKC